MHLTPPVTKDYNQTMYRWAFRHDHSTVWFGPYDTENEAAIAFQLTFGYYPTNFVDRELYNLAARI